MRKSDLWFAVYCFAVGWLAAEYSPELRAAAVEAAERAVDWTTGRALDVADRRKLVARVELHPDADPAAAVSA